MDRLLKLLDKFQQNQQQSLSNPSIGGIHTDYEYESQGIEESSSSLSSNLRNDLTQLPIKHALTTIEQRCNTDNFDDSNSSINQITGDATTKLIMQRYKIKSSHYPSPGINKRHCSTGLSIEHNMQPGTSIDSGSGISEGAIAAANGKRLIM
ncbi:unnamed protein product [Acanthocheilonema viteae]|uniref:Uncharacterized protein n=1 Tax=Acanthocheilonema viteae TaxID=6277 RepID=A0A498SE29_ACAVI|nr:unnamed protein product [Acanthocheilonema viteae]